MRRSPRCPTPNHPAPTTRALAYVIHTGLRGEPKGVMIEQRALVNHLLAIQARFAPGPADCVLLTASIAFDQSIWQVLFPLLAGGRVALPEFDTARGGEEIAAEIRRHEVTILRIVPTLLATLVEGRGLRDCPSLRAVIVAGEVLDRALAQTSPRNAAPSWSTPTGPPKRRSSRCSTPCRGTPLRGPSRSAVRSPTCAPTCSIGMISRFRSACLASSASPERASGAAIGTARTSPPRLLRRPCTGDDTRIYRTGDIVRRLADATSTSRTARPVSLRGVRIELGEIDAALAGHPAVAACAAALWRDAEREPRLAVHYVGRGSGDVPASELQAWLARKLPAAMVPRIFLRLPALPLTPSGKVDRQSLQAPPASAMAATPGDDRVGPRDPVETSIAAVWTELLGLERVDIHQNFFDAGGHSLLAMRLLARIEQLEGVTLRVRDFFESPDIASLARCVIRARTTTTTPALGAIARERDRGRKVNAD
jgi:acyl-coenzyme A synthetase/AMP-(fatty) acid ligase